MMYISTEKSNDMLSHVEVLANEFTRIEITNIDQTNVRRWRAAYFFDKRLPRRNNQLLEIWFEPRNNRLVFVLFKSLLTEEEIKEAENNKRPTKNRGRIYRYNMSQEELLAFVGRKLKLHYSQNNLENDKRTYYDMR